jgi:tRNA modification GTPase
MTIYALSTGPGISGIAIVRISGPEASKVIKLLTGKSIPQPRVATLRKIKNINTSELIDEGIIYGFLGLRATQERIWQKFMCMEAKLYLSLAK